MVGDANKENEMHGGIWPEEIGGGGVVVSIVHS